MKQEAIEILNKVKDSIRMHPDQFNMETWDCGTTACIAGWIGRHTNTRIWGSCNAAQALGVDSNSIRKLFFVGDWPTSLLEVYDSAKCKYMKAEIACEAIDAFINDPSKFASGDQ